MSEAAQKHLDEQKVKTIIEKRNSLDEAGLNAILAEKVRTEKIAIGMLNCEHLLRKTVVEMI